MVHKTALTSTAAAAETDFTIVTEGLSKHFGSFTAVNAIDLAVKKGEIFGFLGANGAGKTTAIRMLCGLLLPSGGRGRVAGFDIMTQTAKIRSRIGYMSQKFGQYADLTVADNLALSGALYGLSKIALQQRRAELAQQLDLAALLPRVTGTIPWGWQQRLALACAVLHRPAVLFLDEPTGSVDPVSRRNFWDLIYRFAAEGTTVFVTTHHMDEAEYCDRIAVMVDGSIADCGSPRELAERHGGATFHEVFVNLVAGTRT